MRKTAILLSVLVLIAAVVIGVQVGQRNTLDKEKTDALAQVDTLKGELGTSAEALSQAKAQLEAITQEKDELAASLDSAKQSLDEALKQVGELGDQKAALETELSSLQQQTEASAAELTQEKDKAALALAEAQVKLETETNSVLSLQTRLAELTKLEGDYTALQAKYDEAMAAAAVTPEPIDVTKTEAYAALAAEHEALQAKYDEAVKQLSATPAPQAKAGEIAVFFTNSVLQRVSGDDSSRIGYPRLATIVKDARDSNPTLLLDAGNALFGSYFPADTQGSQVVALMNALGYDAATPGYYDFALGFDRINDLAGEMRFDLLNSNLLTASGEPAFKPYVIKELGGRRIALVGAMAPGIEQMASPERFQGLSFGDAQRIRQSIEAARQEQPDALILLAYGRDEDIEALAKLPGIDLLILGRNAADNLEERVGDTLVLSAGRQLRSIGHVLLQFDEADRLSLIPSFIDHAMSSDVWPDTEAQQLLELK